MDIFSLNGMLSNSISQQIFTEACNCYCFLQYLEISLSPGLLDAACRFITKPIM